MVDRPIRGSLPRQDSTRREKQADASMPWHMIPLFKKSKHDRHSPTYENSTYAISDLSSFKLKKWLFKNICHIFPCRNESSKTKLAEYCWVITQVVGQSCSGWSGSSVLEFGFQLDSILYNFRTADQMYTQFQLVQNLSCSYSWGMQQLRQLAVSVHVLNHAATANDHIKQTIFT